MHICTHAHVHMPTYAALLSPLEGSLVGGLFYLAGCTAAVAFLSWLAIATLIACQVVFGGVGNRRGAPPAPDVTRAPRLTRKVSEELPPTPPRSTNRP